MLPNNEEGRPGRGDLQNYADAAESSTTFTTLPGRMIALEIDLRELGRAIELRPADWSLARAAFLAASEVRAIRGAAFR